MTGILAPANPQARCPSQQQCGAPPTLSAPLERETVWRSSTYGYQLEYSPDQWQVKSSNGAGIDLRNAAGDLELLIQGGRPASPTQLVRAELSQLRGNILALGSDPDQGDTVLGSAIGYRSGAGGAYVGAIDSPQGVQDQALLNVLAASDGNVGIVATTLTTETSADTRHHIYQAADTVLNTVTWPGQT